MTGLRALVEAYTRAKLMAAWKRESPAYACAGHALAIADAITPDVLAAVEAVVALGEWRATEPQCEPDYAIRDRLDAIADRLAARKGEE